MIFFKGQNAGEKKLNCKTIYIGIIDVEVFITEVDPYSWVVSSNLI